MAVSRRRLLLAALLSLGANLGGAAVIGVVTEYPTAAGAISVQRRPAYFRASCSAGWRVPPAATSISSR
jgi:hypothetical protein